MYVRMYTQLNRTMSVALGPARNVLPEAVGHKTRDLLHVGLVVLSKLSDQVWLLKEDHCNDNVRCQATCPDEVTQRLQKQVRMYGVQRQTMIKRSLHHQHQRFCTRNKEINHSSLMMAAVCY